MIFSISAFKEKPCNYYPKVFRMNHNIDRSLYQELKTKWMPMSVEKVFNLIKKRTSTKYFLDIAAAQAYVQDYSRMVFPSYEFLMPDVLIDDWLSIVDPHKEGKRDHSLHQPLTAFIVSELLGNGDLTKGLMINGRSFLALCAEQFISNDKMEYLRRYYCSLYPNGLPPQKQQLTWAAALIYHAAMEAALFHDIGYPWQFINKVSGGIRNAEIFNHHSYNISALGILTHISHRLLIFPFLGYSLQRFQQPLSQWRTEVLPLIHDAYYNTHGFPGALTFMHLNDKIHFCPEIMTLAQSECRFVQDWAAVGIMMHDMVREYHEESKKNGNMHKKRYRLFVDVDPVSCIIAMADIFEEFGRPKAIFAPKEEQVNITYDYHCESTEIDVQGDTLMVRYSLTPLGRSENKAKDIQKEFAAYFNSDNGFINLNAIGINKITCQIE